jgi:Peptidase inhibitor family I36
MSVLKRVALTGASSLLALGALAGLTGVPASAQVAKPTHAVQPSVPAADSLGCGAHTFCMWNMADWFGAKWSFNYNTHAHDKWLYVGNGANDAARSLDNNRAFVTGVALNYPAGNQWACVTGRVPDLFLKSWPDGLIAQNTISAYFLASRAVVCGTTW